MTQLIPAQKNNKLAKPTNQRKFELVCKKKIFRDNKL